jgi:hypothetical protein
LRGTIPVGTAVCPHCGERLIGDASLPADAGEIRRELDEIKSARRRQNLLGFAFGLPGLALQVGGGVLARAMEQAPGVGLLLQLVGLVLLAVGIGFVAVYKGRNPAWALMSLLGCIGLIVIAVLKGLQLARIKELEGALKAMGRPVR